MDSVVAIHPEPLLAADEPGPYLLHNEQGAASCLLVADHASNRVPRRLESLGLGDETLNRHIGWDIGTDVVALELSRRFDATLVMANYSRLVIDLNRALSDPTVMPPMSDQVAIPGNERLSEAEKAQRVHEIFVPYRQAVDQQLDRLRQRGRPPALIAIHSFTPVMNGRRRPWHVGILWDKDPRIAVPLMAALGDHPVGPVVGDNEPYSGKHPADYTIDHHGEANGLPHVSIEIRQDLIDRPDKARNWAGVLFECLSPILADPDLYRIWQQ